MGENRAILLSILVSHSDMHLLTQISPQILNPDVTITHINTDIRYHLSPVTDKIQWQERYHIDILPYSKIPLKPFSCHSTIHLWYL
jgi:hypothetical protein